MDIKDIIYLVIAGVIFIITVISTIVTFLKKKKSGEIRTETISEDYTEFSKLFKTNLEKVIGYVIGAEKFYNSITTGKVGDYKLENVLQKIQVDCMSKGETFDKDYWTEIVNNIVAVMNTNKQ